MAMLDKIVKQAHIERRFGIVSIGNEGMVTEAVIAIDAMGGDFGPAVTMDGLARILRHARMFPYLLFGNEDQINTELQKHKTLADVCRIIHCDVDVPMDAKPSVALRQGRKVSGMWKAIHAVKEGEAQACVSAGNTGALMAMSKVILRTQPGIERPAIACIWPTVCAAKAWFLMSVPILAARRRNMFNSPLWVRPMRARSLA